MTFRALFLAALALCACKPNRKTADAGKPADPGGPSHGKFESSIANLRAQLQKEPCDKENALMLGDYLNRAKDYAGASTWVGDFEKACGRWHRLLWVRSHACKQLSDWPCAIDTATALIEGDPSDSDYWWWRGESEAFAEHWEQARADYFQSMANKPTGFPANRLTKFVDAKLKRPCDGALLIQWWVDHGKRTQEEWIDAERTRLYVAGACDKHSGKGKALVAAAANAPLIRVQVKLDGASAAFLLDEHAGTSAVTAAVLQRASLASPAAEPKVQLLAAGAVREGPLTRVKRLQLGGATAEEVDLVVLDALPEGIDGIVGLNVLMQFQVKRTPKGFELSPLP